MPNLFYVHGTKNLFVNDGNQDCRHEVFADNKKNREEGMFMVFRKYFPNVTNIYRFIWNGNLTDRDRKLAAQSLSGLMNKDDIVVAHSHGGNVVLEALSLRYLCDAKAYLFATPVMEKFNSKELFEKYEIFEYYSHDDRVQTTCAIVGGIADFSGGRTTCLGLRSYPHNLPGRAREISHGGYFRPHLDMATADAFEEAFIGHR